MRMIFYPAVLGWALLAGWIMTLVARARMIELQITGGKEIFQSGKKIHAESKATAT
jgi:hypothetical protein